MNHSLFNDPGLIRLETDYHLTWIENGIVHQKYKDNLKTMTLEIAKKSVADRIIICNGKTYPIITESNCLTKLNSDARKHLSSDEAHYLLSACALVVQNPFSKLLGNFFLKFEPIKIPARLFTNKEKAIRWLKPYRHMN